MTETLSGDDDASIEENPASWYTIDVQDWGNSTAEGARWSKRIRNPAVPVGCGDRASAKVA